MDSGTRQAGGAANQLVRTLMESAESGLLVCDTSQNLVHFNAKARKLLGWSGTAMPASCAELDPISGETLKQALTGAPTKPREVLTPLGPATCHASPYFDERGAVVGAVLSLHRTPAAMTEAEVQITEVLEMTADAIMMFDREWRYTYLNAKAVELAGKRREALLGTSVWDQFPEAVSGAFYSELQRAVSENKPVHFENYFAPLGKWFENDAYPSPAGVSVFYRDITGRKRTEAQLHRNTEELVRSNDDLQQFTYAVSHDLQEPLRTVNMYTQLLSKRFEGKLDEDSNELLTAITDSARRMRDMIRDLLVYSRVAQGGEDDWTGPVNLEEVLQWASENLRVAIAESGAVITSGPLPVVVGVEVQLRQLFQNLIGNAIKYRGPESPRLHIEAENDGSQWVLSFRDNGIGVEAKQHERIFGLFKRGQQDGKKEGTGVGLALCRRIAVRHGGKLDVESKPGEGSTFYLRLPLGV